MSGLRERVLRGLFWRSGVSGGQHLLRILFTILLARLLTTADFGLVAMALLVTRFVQCLSQVQFGAALIQDARATEGQISAVFWCNLGINAVVSLLCFLAAPLAAGFFGEPRLAPIVAVLAWSLLISGFAFPNVLLRKRMEFGSFSALELASMLVGNTVAVVAAFRGLGVWSLVIRLMTQRIVFAAGVWWLARWRPTRPDFRSIGRHLRFGLHLQGSNVLYYASQNLVAILVGKLIGADTLGCFSIAFSLAVVPAQQVQGVLTTVLAPAFALLQSDRAAFRRKAYVSMFALGLVYIPLMAGLAAVARPFVLFAYGEAWTETGTFLTLLAGVGLVKGLEHLLRCVILAAGRSAAILRITALEAGAALLFAGVGAQLGGANGLVAAYLASACVSGALTLREAHAAVGGDPIFMRAIGRSFAVAAAMGAVVMSVAALVPWRYGPTLVVQVLVGVALYVFLRLRALSDEERAVMRGWPLAGLVVARR